MTCSARPNLEQNPSIPKVGKRLSLPPRLVCGYPLDYHVNIMVSLMTACLLVLQSIVSRVRRLLSKPLATFAIIKERFEELLAKHHDAR